MVLSEDLQLTQEIEMSRQKEIKNGLPDASDEQVKRFLKQVERLEELEKYFEKYPDDKPRYKDILDRAKKALDYQRSYRIALIGVTGAGKSTLTNALLGDDIVLAKTAGKPATGTVLEIFFDLPETESRKAIVHYRDEKNIRALIYESLQRYQHYKIDISWLNSRLDIGFANKLSTVEPEQKITEAEVRKNFENLRETLSDIVKQYLNNNVSSLQCEFFIENVRDAESLKQLIDENSVLNDKNDKNSSTRCIGLIESVSYRLHSVQNHAETKTLQLPKSVCLVDLPGLDGSTLHNIIIRNGIKEADAVIYIIKDPKRINTDSDVGLLSNVRKHISLEGSTESSESVFFVLNAIDSITEDRVPANLAQDMRNLIENFLPGYTKHPNLYNRGSEGNPYFSISALSALLAQKALRGQDIKDPKTYGAMKSKLGVEDGSHEQVLEASQVPKLVEELTNFARDRRIERQILDGELAINNIVETLFNGYEREKHNLEKNQLTDNNGSIYIQKKVKHTLQDKQQILEDLVYEFRVNQLTAIERWRQGLEKEAKHICDLVDTELRKSMPLLWKEALHSKWLRGYPTRMNRAMAEYIIDRTQMNLWKQIAIQLPQLGKYLVQVYSSSLATYNIAQKITAGSYSYQEVYKLESKIKEWVDSMHDTMTEVAGRLAFTKLTDPSCVFLTQDGKLEKRQLIDALPKPSFQPNSNIQNGDFNVFITEVRKEYESFILVDCITGLLNLYRYEMILVEDRLLSLIEEIFHEISKSDAPVLKAQILESLNQDPIWKRLKLLEDKLAALFLLRA